MINSDDTEKGSHVFVSLVKEHHARKERELGRIIENREVAADTGLSEHTIGTWMKPREFRSADAEVVGALATFYNVPWSDLLILRPKARREGKRRGRPARKAVGQS
jgi:hypothetical protein